MGKVITIRVPNWVGEDFMERIERPAKEEIDRAFAPQESGWENLSPLRRKLKHYGGCSP